MVSSLHKTRKQISKKRNGVVNCLHEKSRDSMRLHKAGVRDLRIEKMAAARSKKEQPLSMYKLARLILKRNSWANFFIVDRVAYFQEALRAKDTTAALDVETIQSMINS